MSVPTRTVRAAAVLAIGALSLTGLASSASANAPSVSKLQVTVPSSATPSTPVTSLSIDAAVSSTVVVNVKLDSDCPAAYGTGQKYGVAVISDHTSVATVSPASRDGLRCAGAAASFTISGVGNGGADLTFDPVAKSQGLQKKLAGVVVHVTVSNVGSGSNGGGPAGHQRPAAPAVANAYLGNNAALVTQCKTKYGHSWRGAVIKRVAHWSAAGHWSTKKDNKTLFPTDDSWISKVQGVVDTFC